MTFSQKLKKAMQDLGINQQQVAILTGKCKSSVSQYISGKHVPPAEEQKKIAVSLGLSPDYFEQELPLLKIVKNGNYAIPQLKPKDAAQLMRRDIKTIQKGLQQGKFSWGYAIKTSSKWTYFINAAVFAAVERVEIPEEMIF